jgi:lysylphosphatidylglycerol synthetase-like protein (DUF2156 family)
MLVVVFEMGESVNVVISSLLLSTLVLHRFTMDGDSVQLWIYRGMVSDTVNLSTQVVHMNVFLVTVFVVESVFAVRAISGNQLGTMAFRVFIRTKVVMFYTDFVITVFLLYFVKMPIKFRNLATDVGVKM